MVAVYKGFVGERKRNVACLPQGWKSDGASNRRTGSWGRENTQMDTVESYCSIYAIVKENIAFAVELNRTVYRFSFGIAPRFFRLLSLTGSEDILALGAWEIFRLTTKSLPTLTIPKAHRP
jgi:hypothetical protein